jgi:hypothetical protein
MLFGETVAVYCENHAEHTDTLCGQNVEFVPHRKHITSPLQSPTGKCCLGKQSLFIVRTIRNTQIHCLGQSAEFCVLSFTVLMCKLIQASKQSVRAS